MSGLHKAKSSKKNRKHGRNTTDCLRYKNEQRCEKNKAKRLVKHLAKFGNDNCAKVALGNVYTALGK